MRSTGPVLAIGAVTVGNAVVLNGRPLDARPLVATGIAAGVLALVEKVWADGAVALAWLALVAVLLTRTQPDVPAPAESLATWWQKGSTK